MKIKSADKRRLTRQKRYLFISITLLLILCLLEGGAGLLESSYLKWREKTVYEENPFIVSKNYARVFEPATVEGEKVFQRTPYHWIMKPQQFSFTKSPDTLRVFCVGGSAANGWPHLKKHTFPFYLDEKLKRIYPDKKIEILNVAGKCHASYRVKVVFDEIIDYDPDLIVIYSGNNEFLEDFIYGDPLNDPADKLGFPWKSLAVARTFYRFLQATLGDETDTKHEVDITQFGLKDHKATRISFAFGLASRRKNDPEQFAKAVEHYRFNIESMLAEGKKQGVPVFVLRVPVNLKDWKPNVSRHAPDLNDEQLGRWQAAFREALACLRNNDATGACDFLEKAISIDPAYAEAHFLLGKALHALGDYARAKCAFVEAMEQDAYPFRCLSRFDRALTRACTKYGTKLIDLVFAFENAFTSDGILGMDALVDYVHPTAAGNELIAHEILAAMEREGLVPASSRASAAKVRMQVSPAIEESPQVLQPLYAQMLVMRQYDKLDLIAQKLLAIYTEQIPTLTGKDRKIADNFLERLEYAQQVIKPYRDLLEAEKIGRMETDYTPDEIERIVNAYAFMIRDTEAENMPVDTFMDLFNQMEK